MTVHTTIPKVVTLTSRTPQGIDYWQQNTTLKYCAFLLIQSFMNISLLLLIPGKIFIRNSINRLILIRLATSKSRNTYIYKLQLCLNFYWPCWIWSIISTVFTISIIINLWCRRRGHWSTCTFSCNRVHIYFFNIFCILNFTCQLGQHTCNSFQFVCKVKHIHKLFQMVQIFPFPSQKSIHWSILHSFWLL